MCISIVSWTTWFVYIQFGADVKTVYSHISQSPTIDGANVTDARPCEEGGTIYAGTQMAPNIRKLYQVY
jgi:hypothetical protein